MQRSAPPTETGSSDERFILLWRGLLRSAARANLLPAIEAREEVYRSLLIRDELATVYNIDILKVQANRAILESERNADKTALLIAMAQWLNVQSDPGNTAFQTVLVDLISGIQAITAHTHTFVAQLCTRIANEKTYMYDPEKFLALFGTVWPSTVPVSDEEYTKDRERALSDMADETDTPFDKARRVQRTDTLLLRVVSVPDDNVAETVLTRCAHSLKEDTALDHQVYDEWLTAMELYYPAPLASSRATPSSSILTAFPASSKQR